MTEHGKARLTLLSSGIPNLDSVLGGGFPEYSCNLIAGDPGSGKTTLCHQIIFANASPDRPALYFTIMGEPPLKMLRYQQQFSFFDPAKVDGSIHMTVENNDNYTELRFSPHAVSFMTNDIILQRYVEIDSQLRRVMTVIKTRSRMHPSDLRSYKITRQGIVGGDRFSDYQGVITGVAQLRRDNPRPAYSGLTDQEAAVFSVLVEMHEADERALAERTGLQRGVLAKALKRLVEVDYATKVVKDDGSVYQPRRTLD